MFFFCSFRRSLTHSLVPHYLAPICFASFLVFFGLIWPYLVTLFSFFSSLLFLGSVIPCFLGRVIPYFLHSAASFLAWNSLPFFFLFFFLFSLFFFFFFSFFFLVFPFLPFSFLLFSLSFYRPSVACLLSAFPLV